MDKKMLEHCLESSLKMSQEMKTHFSREANGKEDIRPFIIVGLEMENDEGEKVIAGGVAPMELQDDEHPVDTLPKMLNELNKQGLEKFAWLCFITEGYARSPIDSDNAEEIEKLRNLERGALEKEFNEKADTDIKEGIIATLFSWENESLVMTSFYKWGDDGLPIFDEINNEIDLQRTEEMDGKIPFIFNAFVKYCQMSEMLNNEDDEKDTTMWGEKYDYSKKPSFAEVWSVLTEDDDSRVSKKVRAKVTEFNMRAFTARVARDCWAGIQEQIDKGELDEKEFTAHTEAVMSGDDENAKMELVAQLVKKYSLLGNSIALASGRQEIPNDISELLG